MAQVPISRGPTGPEPIVGSAYIAGGGSARWALGAFLVLASDNSRRVGGDTPFSAISRSATRWICPIPDDTANFFERPGEDSYPQLQVVQWCQVVSLILTRRGVSR